MFYYYMEKTEEQKLMQKLFLSAFSDWQSLVQKGDELTKHRDKMKSYYDEICDLINKVEKKTEEMKSVTYYYKAFIENNKS